MRNGNKQYRVVMPIRREGQERTFWRQIGMAWENAGRQGGMPSITIRLDALPLGSADKGAELLLFEHDSKESQGHDPSGEAGEA
jgi:hypothetical protein